MLKMVRREQILKLWNSQAIINPSSLELFSQTYSLKEGGGGGGGGGPRKKKNIKGGGEEGKLV